MHTDEFEISLRRELDVCKSTIKRIQEFLSIMERKHKLTTAEFIQRAQKGTLSPELQDDSEAWQNNFDSLLRWQEMQKQYEEMFHTLKISQPKQVIKLPFKKKD